MRDTTRGKATSEKLWGTYPSTVRLPNTTFGPTTPELETCDLAVVDGSVYRCTDPTPGSAVWERIPEAADIPGASGSIVRYYGDLFRDPALGTAAIVVGTGYTKIGSFSSGGGNSFGVTEDSLNDELGITSSFYYGKWRVKFTASVSSDPQTTFLFGIRRSFDTPIPVAVHQTTRDGNAGAYVRNVCGSTVLDIRASSYLTLNVACPVAAPTKTLTIHACSMAAWRIDD